MSRQLYDDLISYEGNQIFNDVLSKHIEDLKSYLTDCEPLKSYDPDLTLHSQALENNKTNHNKLKTFNNSFLCTRQKIEKLIKDKA